MNEPTNLTPAVAATTPARTADVIASEIIGIKEAARKTMQTIATGAAVEIGKRLKEAKALVPYGAWGEWLRVHVDYSERTAQNLLRIAEESAKGSFEALLGLNYTQAVQLIGLPEAARSDLLEENDVTDLSTRELQELVDRYRRESADRQQTIDSLLTEHSHIEKDNEDIRLEMADASQRAAEAQKSLEEVQASAHFAKEDAKREIEAAKRAAEAAKAEADKAKRTAAEAIKRAESMEHQNKRLEDELVDHRDRQLKIQEPQALAEVKATVVEVIPPEIQDELTALREKERLRLASEATATETLKREGAEFTFRLLYEQFTGQFKKLTEAIGQMSPENQAKYGEALRKAITAMLGLLPGNGEAYK